MKLLLTAFLFNIGLIDLSFSAPPMSTDEAKSLLLKHTPKLFLELNEKALWDEAVKEKSLIEVDETFIPGSTVIRILHKPSLVKVASGEYLHTLGGNGLMELTPFAGCDSLNAQKLFSKSDDTRTEVVYLCVANQGGFGRYMVFFYHLSASAGKDPIVKRLPNTAFIASGELGQFWYETSTSTIRYKLKSAEMPLFQVDIQKPLNLAISLHKEAKTNSSRTWIMLPE